jgi:hypothetical protein
MAVFDRLWKGRRIERMWKGHRIDRLWKGRRIERIWRDHRKVVLAGGAVVVVVALLGTGLLLASTGKASVTPAPSIAARVATASPTATATASPTPTPSATPSGTPGPTPLQDGFAYSDLDGVAAPAADANRLPMAVMIGDYPAARPLSGFSTASIVYQSYEEYQEDRYMLVFQEQRAVSIGGVRSTRPYFVRWAAEYKALLGHDGGDTTVRTVVIPAMIANGSIYNMDEGTSGGCAYHRVTNRVSPHNLYTTTSDLISCAASKGFPKTFQVAPTRTFVDDTPAIDLPASQSITVPYTNSTESYRFDPTTDSYLRLINGQLQIDAANNQQVYARNIVVMFQTVSQAAWDFGIARIDIANVGTGKAIVFQEGRAITGTWKKTSDTALTRFYDDSNNEIPLVRGETFIQSVPPGTAVTYN